MPTMQQRIHEATLDCVRDFGWSRLNLSRIAEVAGISRQTIYNEVGTKERLAALVVARSATEYLEDIVTAFESHPDSVLRGLEVACTGVFARAASDPLVLAARDPESSPELLRLLTTESDPLVRQASVVLAEQLGRTGEPRPVVEAVVDVLLRLALSYVVRPDAAPEVMTQRIVSVARGLLAES